MWQLLVDQCINLGDMVEPLQLGHSPPGKYVECQYQGWGVYTMYIHSRTNSNLETQASRSPCGRKVKLTVGQLIKVMKSCKLPSRILSVRNVVRTSQHNHHGIIVSWEFNVWTINGLDHILQIGPWNLQRFSSLHLCYVCDSSNRRYLPY